MKKKFRFRLNLFDGIILILGLLVVAVLGYFTLRASATPETATNVQTIRYTVRFSSAVRGTGEQIEVGDTLLDSIKNYSIGTVESVEVSPARIRAYDEKNHTLVYAEVEELEDILITVVTPATLEEDAVILDGGYTLRVNTTAYVRGEGYVGYGPVLSIERLKGGEQA